MKGSMLDKRSNVISLPTLRVIGLMSGTSMDGCDAVLTEISPKGHSVKIKTLGFLTHPMPENLRARILKQLKPETSRIDELTQLDAALGNWFVEAIESLLNQVQMTKDDIDLIGSHGQTMWHDVQPRTANNAHLERMTWQLGDGSFLSAKTGVTTVCDFRTADVALGGQGAPLMPVFDNLIYGTDRKKTIALQNIGGIGNVTILPQSNLSAQIMGFDTGPGNMIIDRFAEIISGGQLLYDEDGKFAAQGTVNEPLLDYWLQHSFFQQLPPKSTGREQFGHDFADIYWQDAVNRNVSPMDAIATATALTAKSIALAYEQAEIVYTTTSNKTQTGVYPEHVIVAGGGARNPTLMHMLAGYLRRGVTLTRAGENDSNNIGEEDLEDIRIESDSKEAVAFAVFAYQAVCGRTNHLPSTTGASHEIILGKICPGLNFHNIILRPLPRHYLPSGNSDKQKEKIITSVLPVTETRNFASLSLDSLDAVDMVQLMNDEDAHVAQVVASLQMQIAELATVIADRIMYHAESDTDAGVCESAGRVFYVGAGTSGRLGVLDASEIPPTFSAPSEWFQGIIAGGDRALRQAIEGAEDNEEQGEKDILAQNIRAQDVVIGIASSGTTPYVHGALRAAKRHQSTCHTVLLSCNPVVKSYEYVDTYLTAVVGPELLTGSTRLKAGTATKLILNQLSTTAMILSGKTFGNLMVDLRVSNQKLKKRALRILQMLLPGVNDTAAANLLENAGQKVKTALVMHIMNCHTKEEAEEYLLRCGGRIGKLFDFNNQL